MCEMFSNQNPENYTSLTRSIRLNGQSTSIRLETLFWEILDEMATYEQKSTPQFISMLHLEVLKTYKEAKNFSSLLRCACILHIKKKRNTQ